MNSLKTMLSYIFSPTPGELRQYIAFSIIVGLLFLAALVMHFIYKERKKNDPAFRKLFKKTTPRLVFFGIFFLFYTMVRYETIPYFSMRLWFYAGLLLLAFFVYKTVKTYRLDYPREKHNVAQIKSVHVKKQENKYLPNKKK